MDEIQEEGLYFKSGGDLDMVRWVYDDVAETGDYKALDVTDIASQYLMEPVTLKDDIRLVDIFKLLHKDDVLSSVFRRDWAKEYIAESLKPATQYTGEYSEDGIEYLELYQYWEKDSIKNELTCNNRLSFHGIGFVLLEDMKQNGYMVYKQGSRIQWGLTGSHLSNLLMLPLRYNNEVVICESNTDLDNYGAMVEKIIVNRPTLGQVIHGVLWELSFHGGPAETEEFNKDLKNRMNEVDLSISSDTLDAVTEIDIYKL